MQPGADVASPTSSYSRKFEEVRRCGYSNLLLIRNKQTWIIPERKMEKHVEKRRMF